MADVRGASEANLIFPIPERMELAPSLSANPACGRNGEIMVRLVSVALLVLSLPTAAWSNPPKTGSEGQKQSFHMPRPSGDYGLAPDTRIGQAEFAPNAYFGFGMFGLKSEKSHLRPVTAREIDAPKQRRAAIGFSLQF